MLDPILMRIKGDVGRLKVMAFKISGDGTLQYKKRLYAPKVDLLWERILAEAYESRYAIYPGSMKMYHDLKVICWRNNMKWDVASFVVKCMVCQQVKVEHMRP